jgi:CRP-like cAMP-binding protein
MALLDWMKKKAGRKTLDQRTTDARAGSNPSSAPVTATGEVTDRYDNLGEIARGGMGAILKVRDKSLRRHIAMKILEPSDGVKDESRAGLFREEAQITSQLDHPNICPIHEYGRDAVGTNYFTMKVVRGRTLTEIIHDPGYDPANPDSLRGALNALLKVCDALAFAHNKGVLHRDLKPDNIMIGDFGQVYLMDWGVAYLLPQLPAGANPDDRVTVSREGASATDGAIVGTLMYMPPEQARGAVVDVRTDVFGVGAILYEVLTQVPPYYAQNIGDLVLMAQGAGWRPPQEMCGTDLLLPSALCAICERAMAADPSNRYPDVAALKKELEDFLVGGMTFPTQTVPAGECVVIEGDLGDTAYVIQRGYCRVFRVQDGQQVAFADLGPGDVFGEAAVFADSPRMATIQALTEVVVQVVHKSVFEKDLGMASAMGAFVKALAKRFVSTDQQLRQARGEVQVVRGELAQAQQQFAQQQQQQQPASTSAPPSSALPAPEPLPLPPPPQKTSPSEPAPAPAPLALPPMPTTVMPNPLALLDAAMKLQSLSKDPKDVGALLLEAIARGTDALIAERGLKPKSPE